MGKKRRMIANPQKFGRKYANHPAVKAHTVTTTTVATPVVEEVATTVTPVVEEVTTTVTPVVEKTTTTAKTKTKKKKSTWSRKKTTQSAV